MRLKDFTIGADPEFVCSENGILVKANESGVYGDDPLGADGGGRLFEVRPQFSKNPVDVVNSMKKILTDSLDDFPHFMRYKFEAGAYKFNLSIGGHIHFGIKEGTFPHNEAVCILAQYLGPISMLLENKAEGAMRRKSGDYGNLFDFRRQEHGFEYRALSSWIGSPHVALSVLCLAKTVMFEALNNKKFQPENHITEKQFRDQDIKSAKTRIPKLWEDIENMALFKNYNVPISMLMNLIEDGKSWNPSKPMNETWGISKKVLITNKVTLKEIWEG